MQFDENFAISKLQFQEEFLYFTIIVCCYVCIRLNCPLPEADINTKVTASSLEPGGVASYTCDRGYELFGQSTRTCGEKWLVVGRCSIVRNKCRLAQTGKPVLNSPRRSCL
ncbi:hypothetical protein Anas_02657 [Armadillidium nasatum]|uniref:Sushi domain-containing protein n=1 Tax=Armadillidium nasatum TaxID=96803 RepID=A0A5N5SXJ0_9CRUS|nr:hypothetical protein Anas_02657 [Armadillidium nasatum]